MTTPEELATMRQLCIDLPLMKERLMRAGLYITAHAMEAAVKQVGYETAEYLNGNRRLRLRADADRREGR